MFKNDFIHVHVHSDHSALDGCAKTSELAKLAHDNGHRALCLTDHGTMSNVLSLFQECKKYDLNAVVGCEFYLSNVIGKTDDEGKRLDRSANHSIVLAKSETGYKSMCRLNYLSFTEGYYYRPKISRNQLFDVGDDIIVTTSCMIHEINRLIIAGKLDEADQLVAMYKKRFKDDFYIELQMNEIAAQKKVNKHLIELAAAHKIKMILTADVHYPFKGDAELQDLVIHMNRGTTVESDDNEIFTLHARNLYYLTADDFLNHNKKWKYDYDPVFVTECLNNTLEIADKCKFGFVTGKLNFPVYTKDLSNNIVEDPRDFLKQLCIRKFLDFMKESIIPWDGHEISEYEKRLKYELDTICENGYADYFLIIYDMCEYARINGIAKGAARGSVSGSLIAFLLGITAIDPLRFNLFFERFMGGSTTDDVRTPDIDLDFDSDRKDELEKYLMSKYGSDRVVHVVTNSTFNPKGVLRDLTRVLARKKEDVEFINKLIPDDLKSIGNYFMKLREAIVQKEPEDMNKTDKRIYEWFEKNSDLVTYADRLLHQLRHFGKHACAVIITPGPVYDYIPVNKVQGELVTGFQESGDAKELQELGLLKIDILGLNNVSIIDHTIDLVKKTQGKDITPEVKNIDLNNPVLYERFAAGHNAFVFQFSGDGINKLIRAVKPDCFDDVCAINSLYRPANLASGMAWEFPKYKKEPHYVHPILQSILGTSYGMCCYQEDLMRICHDIADFSWVDADKARKILDKWSGLKEKDRDKFKEKFTDGCKKHGLSAEESNTILEFLIQHIGYLFNKSHSVAYSLLAMQTIYLKIYYPLEFYATVLSRTTPTKNGAAVFVEAIENVRSMGIEILPFDINKSKPYFSIENNALRTSFSLLDGLGSKALSQLLQNQPYEDIYDFCQKNIKKGSKLNKKNIDALAKIGAFSCFEENWAKADGIISIYQSDQKLYSKSRNQFDRAIRAIIDQTKIDDWDARQKMDMEFRTLGCNIFFSPFTVGDRKSTIAELAKRKMIKTIPQIKESNGASATVALIARTKPYKDKRGRPMMFTTIKDFKGNESDMVVFADAYNVVKSKLEHGALCYLVCHSSNDSLIFGPGGWGTSKRELDNCILDIDNLSN